MVLLAALACTVDYAMEEIYPFAPSAPPSGPVDVAAPAVEGDEDGDPRTVELLAPGEDTDIDLAFNIWFQEGDWGETDTLCMFELAFYERNQEPMDESSGGGQVVEYPTQAGTCAYTSFSGEDQAMDEPTMMATRTAGDVVYLDGPDRTWELELFEDSWSGQSVYKLQDCTYDTFPFGQLLTLDVPGGEEAGALDAFVLEDVIAVGPAIHLDSPSNQQGDDNVLDWDQDDDMKVGWHFGQDAPEVDGDPLDGQIYLMIRNQDADTMALYESLACMPDRDERFFLGNDELHQLLANASVDEDLYSIAFQIDTWYTGPRFESPWGGETEVRSVFTTGGLLNLYE